MHEMKANDDSMKCASMVENSLLLFLGSGYELVTRRGMVTRRRKHIV